jgi:hypothetical protein
MLIHEILRASDQEEGGICKICGLLRVAGRGRHGQNHGESPFTRRSIVNVNLVIDGHHPTGSVGRWPLMSLGLSERESQGREGR